MTTETDLPPPPRPGSDFARLSRKVADAGLLDRRPGYYAVRIGLVAVAYAAAWSVFAAVGDSWWTLALAAVLAVVFAQVALVAHDLAHRQVFRTRRPSEIAGRIAGNLGIGMSYGWWQDKHTRHHANPNHEELDPDVSPEILVWSERQAGKASGLTRVIAARQAFLFFPLLTLEGFNLHVASVRATLDPRLKRRRLELGLLLAHIAGYLAAVFAVLPPGKAVAFIVLHQALFGIYLGCTFAPNHKGMPTLTAEDELDYLRKQVLTSRNVSGGALMDVALGGLNHQIEHHLFPSMPTPNLRKAKPIVRQHCAALGVSYAETTLIESYRIALRHMHDVGEPLRSHAQ
ncbi:fatty acid desaturase family protein [Jiangella muralis]|uniref:fatty acid desaturase family protein n=1 Tax=Jiangella muralis TaxID=702383 RepID=UPI00069FD5D7|nr:acyl-CoA desaturase [Jiangella muralis]